MHHQEIDLTDLSEPFRKALRLASTGNWTDAVAIEALDAIKNSMENGKIDWDDSVPEHWAILIDASKSDEEVVAAAAFLTAPIMLVRTDLFEAVKAVEKQFAIVACTFLDWKAKTLKIDKSLLEQHLNADLSHSPIDFSLMSPADLYYATVSL